MIKFAPVSANGKLSMKPSPIDPEKHKKIMHRWLAEVDALDTL